MNITKDKVIYFAAALLVVVCLLSYFVKPGSAIFTIVSPEQELHNYQARYPGDTSLADRVMKSYQLAFVLVQSPYLQKNIISLENVRSWARDRFQSRPDFLHPASLDVVPESYDTIFSAFGYNLFAGIKYWLEECIANLLSIRIAHFHNTSAYQTFNAAYFNVFGKDSEAATLLARYQSDRAMLAIDVVLSACFWLIVSVVGTVYLVQALNYSKLRRFYRMQKFLCITWLFAAISYVFVAFSNNNIATYFSAIMSAIVALFLYRPFKITWHENGKLEISTFQLSSRWVALIVWVSYSLLAVQILTWIRAGVPNNPDPITLLLSSLSGDFIHDPVSGKRFIARLLGIVWLVFSIWTIFQQRKDAKQQQEFDEKLKSLASPYQL
jgi:hypothetical protein